MTDRFDLPDAPNETPAHAATPLCWECGSRITDPDEVTRVEHHDEGTVFAHDRCAWRCEMCDEPTVRLDLHSAHNTETGCEDRICWTCADANGWTCERCSAYCHGPGRDVGDLTVCPDCVEYIEECRPRVIGGYHDGTRRAETRPVLSAWTRAHRGELLGVELEVELRRSRADDAEEVAQELLRVAERVATERRTPRLLWAEHDGSLENGFELISAPAGLDTHRVLWPELLASTACKALRSHDTHTCGLHVHISRAQLTRLQVNKLAAWIDSRDADGLLWAVARRSGNNYCRRSSDTRPTQRTVLHAADTYDRYRALNVTGSRTIEWRIFRGTLRAETVLACIELAHLATHWAADASIRDLTTRSLIAAIHHQDHAKETRHLRACLRRRVISDTMPSVCADIREQLNTLPAKALRPSRTTAPTSAVTWHEE